MVSDYSAAFIGITSTQWEGGRVKPEAELSTSSSPPLSIDIFFMTGRHSRE